MGATAPRVFRILVSSTDLSASRSFYETLLGTPGREVSPGRVYFDCGSVILGVLDRSEPDGSPTRPPTESIYFSTDDLDGTWARAKALGCLSSETLHDDPDQPMGEIVVRPWGERSFYVNDPSGNSLCFVDERTVFTGTPAQVEALRRSR